MVTKEVGFLITLESLIFFLNFIEDNNLLDLHYISPNFTWCNNQSGTARHWARLDRCLAKYGLVFKV